LKWSDEEHWTLKKEILSISLIMAVIGIVIYLMGFILQDPSQRWNIATLINSFFYAILLSIIPFAFFTLSNYRYLFTEEYYHTLKTTVSSSMHVQEKNEIHISSQLKKESLSFLPDELIYAESDGNYVVFHLSRNNMVMKEMIRNSINNIEQQLASIPYYLRTHRAFIVNLKKVTGRNGTTLGYTLRLEGTEAKVPVSRTNTTKFNSIFASYKD
jgi:DNA-binding LytR/AlgR family response regulator